MRSRRPSPPRIRLWPNSWAGGRGSGARGWSDGSVIGLEAADLDRDGELDIRVLEGAASGLVGHDDMDEAGAVIEPGRAAAIVLYENLWAIPFASALRRAGAGLVARGEIPVAALLDSLDAVEAATPVDA